MNKIIFYMLLFTLINSSAENPEEGTDWGTN